jgi:hypothetical protein
VFYPPISTVYNCGMSGTGPSMELVSCTMSTSPDHKFFTSFERHCQILIIRFFVGSEFTSRANTDRVPMIYSVDSLPTRVRNRDRHPYNHYGFRYRDEDPDFNHCSSNSNSGISTATKGEPKRAWTWSSTSSWLFEM